VSPLEFIPVAESSGFIIELGDWIIRDALKQYQAIQAIDVNNSIFMTINVSVLQFEDASFVDKLAREVEQFQINPKLIVLEITETKLMNNIQNMLPFFNMLNKKGFRLAIDDFGTGYSSLNYIKQLPLNFIKIDKSFVDAIPADQNDISIVKAIIEIGKAFELEIIAEGVEYQAQAQCLLEQSCEYAQGYL
jgi:EAL domain-containing protein (putative c-di-GMP-specific phosphodiesterase class I)